MKKRAVVAAVAGWVTVVGVSSAVAWVAIDRAGQEVLTAPSGAANGGSVATGAPRTPVGSGPEVTPTRTAATSGSGTRTTSPTTSSGHSTSSRPRPSSPAPTRATTTTVASPAAVDRTVRVEGGQVGVRCVGRTASLRFAQPADGWSVKVEDDGGHEHVKLTFTSSGQHREIEVEAACSAGTPVFSTSDDREGQSDD